ncbi:IclR family transcriptional regulator [Gordonia caeni]|uniref:IclR family transcriptional regulator C-terminal domain-containing protein n=1 Tax=Gordonia caeni TaxID=1007097 RepID=A0ABP7NLS7_9ACTN
MSAIQLLVKASQLVDEVSRVGPSTPAQLAKIVGEPRPTIYRTLDALEQIDVVRADAAGALELGTAVLRWGDSAVAAHVDRAELRRQLKRVRDLLGLNAYLFVPSAGGALCIGHVDGSVVDMLDLAPGKVVPWHAGAAGRVLLAGDDGRAAEPASASSPATSTMTAELNRRVEAARKRGWASDDGEVTEGIASLAVPVRGLDGAVLGALAVAGLSDSVIAREAGAVEVLSGAAEGLSGAMRRSRTEPVGELVDAAPETGRGPALILKTGALMDALSDEVVATSARLTELLGEPASSVYRLLATLIEVGWVEQVERRGAYRIGAKILGLSELLTRRLDIRRAVLPVMTRIHEELGETTFMCVRNGTRAVCIERLDGIRVNSRVLRLGRSLPLHVGAAPRAMLAMEPRKVWEEYAATAAHEESSRDIAWRAQLFAELEEIRSRGVAVSDNTVTPGIAAIGAPILDHRGEVVASLSVSGLREGILRERADGRSVESLVRTGAAELSGYLGWAAEAPQSIPVGE